MSAPVAPTPEVGRNIKVEVVVVPPMTNGAVIEVVMVGVASVGDVPNTNAPLPVSSVIAEARFALVGVPRKVATPVPSEVRPVPPFAAASVPASVIVPEVVIGDPETVRPVVPPDKATLVTVPPLLGVADVHVVPFDVRTLPLVPGATTCSAEVPLPSSTLFSVRLVAPVPPLAIGKVPVTPVARGNPVQLVSVPLEGVPRAGVTSAGLVAKTSAPEPVSPVTAEAKLALEGVARNVATPVPRPETPVEIGSPVQFVRTPDAGVPRAGVTSVGDVANTNAPDPVSSEITPASCKEVVAANCDKGFVVSASPPPAAGCHEQVPSPSSRRNLVPPTSPVDLTFVPSTAPAVRPAAVPVQFVRTPLDGVPSAGVIKVGEVAKTSAPVPVSSDITPAS